VIDRLRLSLIAVAVLAVLGLAACAGWEVRPESAVLPASADEVWSAALEIVREREFKISQQDSVKRELKAERDVILRVISERGTGRTADKEKHQIDLTVRSQGDNRSIVDVIYQIEKLVHEDAAFRLIGAIRDRVAARASDTAPAPPRRR
jgi:acetolactate synthase regulatory subunit